MPRMSPPPEGIGASSHASIDALSYSDAWDGYCAGMISTVRLTELMRRDEVFAAWCKRKVKAIRQRIEEANRSEATEPNL